MIIGLKLSQRCDYLTEVSIALKLNLIINILFSLLKLLNRTKKKARKEKERIKELFTQIILKTKGQSKAAHLIKVIARIKLRESNRTNLYSKPYLRPSEAVHEEIIIYKDKKTEFRIVRRTIKVKGIKE